MSVTYWKTIPKERIRIILFIKVAIVFSMVGYAILHFIYSPFWRVNSDVVDDVKNDGLIHFTTPENAAAIIKSGEFIGSTAGLVFPATVILGEQVWTYQFKGLDDVEQKHSYLLKKIKVKKDAANFSVCLKLSGFEENDCQKIRTRILHDKPIVFKTDNLKPKNIEILREWEVDI